MILPILWDLKYHFLSVLVTVSHLLVVDVAVLTLAAAAVADSARGAGRGGRRRGSVGSGARRDDDAAGRGADGVGKVLKFEAEIGLELRFVILQ